MGTSYIASEPVNFLTVAETTFIAHTQKARKPSQENSDTSELIFCLQRLEYLQELEFSNESR